MTNPDVSSDIHRLTCPICNATFVDIFPAGTCDTCNQVVCGHCIQHDIPDQTGAICRDCLFKQTPLGRLTESASEDLCDILSDPLSGESVLAASILGERGGNIACASLCRALSSERPEVRREAAAALGNIKTDATVSGLSDALNDPADAVRARAAASLAQLDVADAVPILKKQVDDPSSQAAGHAIRALKKLLKDDAGSYFASLVRGHPSDFVKCEALGVLADSDADAALFAALDCLDSDVKKVVAYTCKILYRLNDIRAVPALQKLLEKKRPASVRIPAQAALDKLLNPDLSNPEIS